jgi:hypothetical protein
MTTVEIHERRLGTRATEAVSMPRHQAVLLGLLMCVPVPLLTLGGLAAPIPELAQRAFAPLLPFLEVPSASERVAIREPQSIHTLVIRPASGEREARGSLDPSEKPLVSAPSLRSGAEAAGTRVGAGIAEHETVPSAVGGGAASGEEDSSDVTVPLATGEPSTETGSSGTDEASGDVTPAPTVPGTPSSDPGSAGSGAGTGGSGSGSGAVEPPVTEPVPAPEPAPAPEPPAEEPVTPGNGNGNTNGSGNGNAGNGNVNGSGNGRGVGNGTGGGSDKDKGKP